MAINDDDLGDNAILTYSILQISPSGSTFSINSLTGDLRVNSPVMIYTNYQLQITATVSKSRPKNVYSILLRGAKFEEFHEFLTLHITACYC